MEISVIICTYNRSESLKRTLKSVEEMFVPESLRWELIVVDNNSSDNTEETVREFIKTCKINTRYVLEGNQGLSNARNRGVKEANGKILAFTDDDVVVDRNWLINVIKGFDSNEDACIGGRIFPIWEVPPPKWLTKDLYGYLALLDYGDKPFYLKTADIWGANFAVRDYVFRKYGGFDPNLGRVGGKLYGGEETMFLGKLLDGNENILYFPFATVFHCIPKHRLTKKYFRRWHFEQGLLNGMLLHKYTKRNILGIPYYIFGQLLENVKAYVLHAVTFARDRFGFELKIIYLLAFILGRIRNNG